MKLRRSVVGAFLFLIPALSCCLESAQVHPDFTPSERQWIKDHPVVLYAALPWLPPIDSLVFGKQSGVVDTYLKAITRQSGLRFQSAPTSSWVGAQRALINKKVDLLPDVAVGRLDAVIAHQMIFTDPYFATPTVIVTQGNKRVMLDNQSLNTKTIATSGAYASTLLARYPSATLIEVKDTESALEIVAKGNADVAIGPVVVIGPLLRRKYAGHLGISGSLDDLPFVAHMGVRREDRMLYTVLQKSLENLSAVETDDMLENVLDRTDYGKPSLLSIVRYRAPELVTLGGFIVLLGLFAQRTRVARRAAERSELAKSRFLAVMSHEIRTPMNAVLASVEMLSQTDMDGRQVTLTRTASEAAESLLSLLDDVLDLSKLDAKRLTLEFIATDLNALIRKIVGTVHERAREKGLAVDICVDFPTKKDAVIDPTRFRQVLLNLLTNALKFTDHGHIRLAVKVVRKVEGENNGALLRVQVADTGIGISAAGQAGLFEAYTQADSSTTRRFGGSGLGLTISKDLVELMGGTIILKSHLGVGTQVEFSIPVKIVDRQHYEIEKTFKTSLDYTAELALPNVQHRILVVEDHVINQRVIGEQLQLLGVDAVVVSDGKAALVAISSMSFALVLMDCHMPEMDGYETTRLIRQRAADTHSGHLPIIAVSAATDASHMKLCISSGMDGVLKKPLRLDELGGMLETWLGPLPSQIHVSSLVLPIQESGDLSCRDVLRRDIDALAEVLDGDAASRLAHRLKGAAYVAQYIRVGELAEQLESTIHFHLPSYYAETQNVLGQLRNEIETHG